MEIQGTTEINNQLMWLYISQTTDSFLFIIYRVSKVDNVMDHKIRRNVLLGTRESHTCTLLPVMTVHT